MYGVNNNHKRYEFCKIWFSTFSYVIKCGMILRNIYRIIGNYLINMKIPGRTGKLVVTEEIEWERTQK